MTSLHRSHMPAQRSFPSGIDDLASALMKSGLVAFAMVDSGNVIAASPALRELLGANTPYHHIDGQGLQSMVCESDRDCVSSFCNALLREGVRAELRCRLMHSDGSLIPVQLAGALLTVEDSPILMLVVTDLSPWIGSPATGQGAQVIDAYDPATGFAKHALLLDRTRIALAAARRYRRRAAVLRLDLDQLDAMLGALAPAAASEVQATIAETLRNCVRDCDTIARIGRQEFVIMLPEIGQREDAGITAARVIDAVARLSGDDHPTRRLSAVVGIAVFPSDGTNADRLLQAAEVALPSARSTPGGGFALADATSAELSAVEAPQFPTEFLSGATEIDAEHRQLVSSTNQLVRDLKAGADAGALGRHLHDIIDALRVHLDGESRQLGASPYEGAADQRTSDLRFIDELHCILLHVNGQSVTLAVHHLCDWLSQHLRRVEPRSAS